MPLRILPTVWQPDIVSMIVIKIISLMCTSRHRVSTVGQPVKKRFVKIVLRCPDIAPSGPGDIEELATDSVLNEHSTPINKKPDSIIDFTIHKWSGFNSVTTQNWSKLIS